MVNQTNHLLKNLILSCRPKQWTKNLLVFLALFFSLNEAWEISNPDELALLLNLPSSKHGKSQAETKKISIELSKNEIALDGKKITLIILKDKLSEYSSTLPVDLRVDKEVTYDKVIQVLDILKKYKLSNLSLITGR